MQTKRSFLALLTSAAGIRTLATAQSDDEPKPLREREVSFKGKHQSLKEYYLELISQDAEIRKQFEKLVKERIEEGDIHYHQPGTPTIISWVPHSTEFGRLENDKHERFLVLHPLEWAKSHYFWTEDAIFSEFECITTNLESDDGSSVTEVKAVYRFFGFRKIKLEPVAP